MMKMFKRNKVKDTNNSITDEEILEIERKAKEEVDEMFDSTVRDVEYIEVCYRNGETKRFEHDELEWYSRDDTTLDIRTKMERVLVCLNETREITIKDYKKCPEAECSGNMILQSESLEFTENGNYMCDKCGHKLLLNELLN